MAVRAHVVSTHLPPAKDRSLAASLLRMSERRGLQDDFVVETVVYCGDEEPLNGWANTVPTARYSESNRPKDVAELPRKRRAKPKLKQVEGRESLGDVYAEIFGITTRADGHYHASATLDELYSEYKKRQKLDDHSKLQGMVDPITFRYIPIDQRLEYYCESDDASGLKLPVLKMTHANKQAKLLQVLESFMNRKSDDFSGRGTDVERYAVKGQDAASFYDKYRWYFKDKQNSLSHNMKIKRRRGRLGKRKGVFGSKNYSSENDSDDSVGRRRRRRRNSPSSTYVIQVRDERSKTLTEETITFERKVDYGLSAPGGPGIDRWVAHVVVKDSVPPEEGDTNTSSAVSRATMKSSFSATKVGKSFDRRATNTKKENRDNSKYLEYRLSNRKSNNKLRNGRRLPASFYELYHMSLGDTAKVTMKYNVAAGRRQGAVPDHDDSPDSLEEGVPHRKGGKEISKKRKMKPAPVQHPKKHMGSGGQLEPKTQKVLPIGKKADETQAPSEESKLVLPPLKSKRQPHLHNVCEGFKTKKKSKNREQATKLSKEDKTLASQHVLESSEERQVKSPSSSTFNPDRMFQQMKDTADFITQAAALSKSNKSIKSLPRFLSHIEDARTGDASSSSKSDPTSRKPLHPKQGKNRGQDRIQQMIDEEKAFVSQIIRQLNSKWREEDIPDREQIGSVSESVQDALSTAIAKARLNDLQTIGSGLGPLSRATNQVMKRRVVPPMKEKSSVPTTNVGSGDNFFLTDSAAFPTTKPKLPAVKPRAAAFKKSEARGLKPVQSLSKDRNDTFKGSKLQPGVRFVADGNLMITKQQPTVPRIFEASISSIKPARRIANVNQTFDLRQRA